jgi:hypothetical protein
LKKYIVFLWVICLFILCSCQQAADIAPLDQNAASLPNAHFRYEFTAQEELIAFIEENTELRQIIVDNYPTKKGLDPENHISVYSFSEPPFNSTLNQITYSGNFINYVYYTDGFKPVELSVSDSKSTEFSYNSETAESPEMIEPVTIESSANKHKDLGDEGINEYYKENGLNDYERNQVESSHNQVTLSWAFVNNGNEDLEYFTTMNSDTVEKLAEGIYASDADNIYEEEPCGKVLYWTKDDYFFYAAIPTRYVDEFIKRLTDDEDFIAFATYQAKTAIKTPLKDTQKRKSP